MLEAHLHTIYLGKHKVKHASSSNDAKVFHEPQLNELE